MKLSAGRDVLLKPLQAVIGVVERRQTMPVLSNVLLVCRQQRHSAARALRPSGVLCRHCTPCDTQEDNCAIDSLDADTVRAGDAVVFFAKVRAIGPHALTYPDTWCAHS